MRYVFVGYVVAEVAAFWAMTATLGFGWALLITLIATGVGYAMLGRRARNLHGELRRAMRREVAPGRPATDSALFAIAAALTIAPGVVSTVVGLLLMTPPARRLLGPALAAGAARRAAAVTERVGVVTVGGRPMGGRGFGFAPHEYVDGTVDGTVVDTTVRNPDGSVLRDRRELPRPADD